MDNAKSHTQTVDQRFHEEACKDGWDIRIRRQPAKSPDLNILDLGFFNSIQSLQYEASPKNMTELAKVTTEAFYNQQRIILDNLFYSLQLAMMGILDCGGNNTYKLAHISKDKLRNQNKLPDTLPCCEKLLEKGKQFLSPHVVDSTTEAALVADPRLLNAVPKKETFKDTINSMIQDL